MRLGEPPRFGRKQGESVWSYFTKTNPDEGTLADVAGGNGTLLCVALGQHPCLGGVVTDLAFTMPAAEAYIAAQGLSDRATAVAADFFSSVPTAADA